MSMMPSEEVVRNTLGGGGGDHRFGDYLCVDWDKCVHTIILDFISAKFTRPISTISKFVKEGGHARKR